MTISILFPFAAGAFEAAGFVDDTLKQTDDGLVGQRTGIAGHDPFENPLFPFGIIDGQTALMFESADCQGQFCAAVEDFEELGIQLVYFLSDVFECQKKAPA